MIGLYQKRYLNFLLLQLLIILLLALLFGSKLEEADVSGNGSYVQQMQHHTNSLT